MPEATQIVLYAMNQKGLAVLEAAVGRYGPSSLTCVVGARDATVQQDFYDETQAVAIKAGIPFFDRKDANSISADYAIAIGWRWLIRGSARLVVFHDSLLPRYRGFAPLPNALINGEAEVGVTALWASEEYDGGDIIAQRRLPVRYPIRIQEAIDLIAPLYADLAIEVIGAMLTGAPLAASPQDESAATYSPWRDEEDYRIRWSDDAATIKRFIDALGTPYSGAAAEIDGKLVRILDATEEPEITIEQRSPGKVMFIREGLPVVTCGRGMLRLNVVENEAGSALPLKKFRTRFR